MIFGYAISGGGGNGKSGATLTVTAPIGSTVTVSKGSESYSSTMLPAVFSGLSTGTWAIFYTDGSQSGQTSVDITADYSTTVAYFSATINITYPSGSTCTVSNGDITHNAPDTSGTWACVVNSAGTWTVTATDGSKTTSTTVDVTENGQSKSITLCYDIEVVKNSIYNTDIALTKIKNNNLKPSGNIFRNSAAKDLTIDTSDGGLTIKELNTDYAGCWIVIDGVYDVSKFSTFEAEFSRTVAGGNTCFGLGILSEDASDTTGSLIASNVVTVDVNSTQETHTASLDLTGQTGNVKFAFAATNYSASLTCTFKELVVRGA